MNTVFHPEHLSSELRRCLDEVDDDVAYVLKAVIVANGAGQGWGLLGCTVKPAPRAQQERLAQRHNYGVALLGIEYLRKSDLEALLASLSGSEVSLFGEVVKVDFNAQSESQRVPVNNQWMKEAGSVFTVRQKSAVHPASARLLAFGASFYPDCYEAARDWLGLREHHGHSDGRKGDFMLMLPETQALIADWSWQHDTTLNLEIAGPAADKTKMEVLGAFWCGQKIHHFNAPVEAGKASFTVAAEADRLELFLLGEDSREYDSQRDDLKFPRSERTFLGTRRSTKANDRVAEALLQGEGPRIEFKEFLDLPKRKEPMEDKSKLHQIVRTVAAFANTGGGTLYLGIENDCVVVGAMKGVRKFDETEAAGQGTSQLNRYIGALRTRIREEIYPEVHLTTSEILVEEHVVIAIDVERSVPPVSVVKDAAIIVRRGSNNVRIQPAEWKPRDTFLPS